MVSKSFAEDPQDCVSCHQQQVSNWIQSDHAKAMSDANSNTVLGDFNNIKTSHFSQKARFYKDKERFYIEFTEAAKTSTYEVAFTFGHYPLQQYLIPATNGRYQIFPFAWDSRPSSEGGQRWFPNYQEEDIKPNDRLHWQQSLQNWNGMCADCHSDGLTRNYNIKNNSFDTKWDNINVGCQSCHSKMDKHSDKSSKAIALIDDQQQKDQVLSWLLKPGDNVARLTNHTGEKASKREKQSRQNFMDTCFACHSLRSPLTDGISPNKAFLDQFSPTLITPPYYHADGQIKEEVYVYGSFLQSKMFQEGVTCLDCHDDHTMKIKTQGNGLCLQCHNADNYQTQKHTHHDLTSEAGQCVTCHMPETTYMGVDARRDHSFKIPRPNLSEEFGSPNACINCHQDKTNNWAKKQITEWFGPINKLSDLEKDLITLRQSLHQQGSLDLSKHIALVNSKELSEINRASALLMLPLSTQMLSDYVVKTWVNSDFPLIRLATAKVGHLLVEQDRLLSYQKLLEDEFKAIRVAAAENLINVAGISPESIAKAFAELVEYNEISSWRGEGGLNQSLIDIKLGQYNSAIERLKHAIKVDPYFEASYINLLDIYRANQLRVEEQKLYQKALSNIPKSAALQFSYGLYLIRTGDKVSSVLAFKNAVTYQADNSRYAYLYFLALDAIGKTKQAINELKLQYTRYKTPELKQLGLTFSQKLNDQESYMFFANLK